MQDFLEEGYELGSRNNFQSFSWLLSRILLLPLFLQKNSGYTIIAEASSVNYSKVKSIGWQLPN